MTLTYIMDHKIES